MQHQRKIHPFFIRLFAWLLFLGLPGISRVFGLRIQKGIEKVQIFDIKEKINQSEKAFRDTSINKIQGKAIDSETKEFLPGASVVIKRSTIGTSTDAEGNFSLVVPENLLRRKIVLVVSTVGYVRKEFQINTKDIHAKKDFLLTKWK